MYIIAIRTLLLACSYLDHQNKDVALPFCKKFSCVVPKQPY